MVYTLAWEVLPLLEDSDGFIKEFPTNFENINSVRIVIKKGPTIATRR